MRIRWYYFLFVLGIFSAISLYKNREIHHGPGVIAPNTPQQTEIKKADPFNLREYEIIPQATFSVEARALAVERYRYDRGAELAPIDIAFGWGAMSDERVLSQMDISQSQRWAYWRTKQYPIPPEEINTHFANMHLIPANETVEAKLFSVRVGAIVKLNGKLVNVRRSDGFVWNSSLSRSDKGSGACELVYVEDIEIL